jgi:hypothetical protein
VVIAVTDPYALADGTFSLESDGGEGTGAPTTRTPQLTLTAAALGSVLLGGVRLRTLADAGRVIVHDAGALAVADAMLAWPITPWCSTHF